MSAPKFSNHHHQIIPVDNLLIGHAAEHGADLIGAQADDAAGVGGRVIAQAAGELLPFRIAQSDDVALAEIALDLDDADGQEAAAALLHGGAGAGINDQAAFGLSRE